MATIRSNAAITPRTAYAGRRASERDCASRDAKGSSSATHSTSAAGAAIASVDGTVSADCTCAASTTGPAVRVRAGISDCEILCCCSVKADLTADTTASTGATCTTISTRCRRESSGTVSTLTASRFQRSTINNNEITGRGCKSDCSAGTAGATSLTWAYSIDTGLTLRRYASKNIETSSVYGDRSGTCSASDSTRVSD